MKHRSLLLIAGYLLCCRLVPTAVLVAEDDPGAHGPEFSVSQLEFFEKKIRPVLVKECYPCHSTQADRVQGGLYLDSREGLLEGGDSGSAITIGTPEKSLLMEALRHESFEMPPDKQLTDAVISDFEQWIRDGLTDPRRRPDGVQKKRRVLYSEHDADTHWAFQPVKNPQIPDIHDPWIRTPIDAFVLARLQAVELHPSDRADARTLLRRAFYDLSGLPPTFSQVQQFRSEPSHTSFARVVNQLLESPRYGEHWGRHWLDVARYADTNGQRPAPTPDPPFYPFAWVYRDYVIDAFNRDVPFDRFVIEQLAGDLIADDDNRSLAGVGFLRVGRSFGQNVDDRIDDRIDTLSKAFLALTVSCARCHDHKLDPIGQDDYYALHGILASSEDINPVLHDTNGTSEHDDFVRQRDALITEIETECLNAVNDFLHGLTRQSAEYLIAAQQFRNGELKEKKPALAAREVDLLPIPFQSWVNALVRWKKRDTPAWRPWFAFAEINRDRFAEQAEMLSEQISGGSINGKPVPPFVAKRFTSVNVKSLHDVAAIYQQIFLELERIAGRQYPMAALLTFMEDSPRLFRSEYYTHPSLPPPLDDKELESLRQVTLGFDGPYFMTPRELMQAGAADARKGMVRRKHEVFELEATHPGAPIRVMTMRDRPQPIDSPLYIRGDSTSPGPIVPRRFLTRLSDGSPEPFTLGSGRLELARAIASKSNPLTARVIVNRIWQWHFGAGLVTTPSDFGLNGQPPSHPELLDWLATWFIDHNWSVKELHRLIMNSSVWQQASRQRSDAMETDAENRLLWRFAPRRMTFEELRDTWLTAAGTLQHREGGRPADPESSTHRAVYLHIDRYDLPDVFNTFDFANPEFSTSVRDTTTVPQQALFLMNSQWILDRAAELAAREEIVSAADWNERLQILFEIVVQRQPDDAEQTLLLAWLHQFDDNQQQVALERLAHSLLLTAESMYLR